MSYFNDDTIVACATNELVTSAIGVIRVSGSNCREIVRRFLRKSENKSPFKKLKPRYIYRSYFQNTKEVIIDDCTFCFFEGPKSYTGEDSLEIYCHGSPIIVSEIIKSIVDSALARIALNGEFTFRAFRSGKMDLIAAEEVDQIVGGKTKYSIVESIANLKHRKQRGFESLKEKLVKLLSIIELEIDFSDQDVSVFDEKLWIKDCEYLIKEMENSRIAFLKKLPVKNGLKTAIVGFPNSGKSTFFNYILGFKRSIVADTAGTTRDVVSEEVEIGGILLRLADTAGIRETENLIESEGILRSFGEIENASLVVVVIDTTNEQQMNMFKSEGFRKVIRKRNNEVKIIYLFNKKDLVEKSREAQICAFLKDAKENVFLGSSQTGENMDQFELLIQKTFCNFKDLSDQWTITKYRHYECLGRMIECVRSAVERVNRKELFFDIIAADVKDAVNVCNELTGEDVSESVLNNIFSDFCIGK